MVSNDVMKPCLEPTQYGYYINSELVLLCIEMFEAMCGIVL